MSAHDLDPTLDPDERHALEALGDRLLEARPLPAPAFRGDLRRRLVVERHPRGLRLRALTCLATGTACLVIAALGVADSGPLAPQDVPATSASVPPAHQR